ncbi:MAG: hypothetical protein WBN32_07100 [Woeseia sp.]
MNSKKDIGHIVRKAYRSYSDETAPDELDRAVLREAGAIERSGFWSRFYTWRRPLAFAATLVLGVTLVYDMQTALQQSDTPYLPTPYVTDDDYSRSNRNAPTRAVPGLAQEEIAPAENESRDTMAPAVNGTALRKFSAPTPAADAVQPNAMPARQEKMPSAELKEESRNALSERERDSLQPETAAMGAALGPADAAIDACGDSRFASAETWWRCVQQLRSDGAAAQAEAEWQKLQQRYPDFQAPVSLE